MTSRYDAMTSRDVIIMSRRVEIQNSHFTEPQVSST